MVDTVDMTQVNEYEITNNEEKQIQVQYPFSAKLEDSQSGVRITCHCYSTSVEQLRRDLLSVYVGIQNDLRNHSIPIAKVKNGEAKI